MGHEWRNGTSSSLERAYAVKRSECWEEELELELFSSWKYTYEREKAVKADARHDPCECR